MTDAEFASNARHMADAAGDGRAARGAEIALRRLSDLSKRRAAEWERANNDRTYSESPAHARRWSLVERQRDDVEWELRFFYGARVDWPGLYPVVECADGRTSIYF